MAHAANTERLGERLRATRLGRQIGLRELARRLNITPSYLSDIENDRRVPAEALLTAFAGALQLDFDELMGLAGRLGEETDRYVKRFPAAAQLFRQISEKGLSESQLKQLQETVDKLRS
jgi:transcriptional regulator with XRE-family HTH domain